MGQLTHRHTSPRRNPNRRTPPPSPPPLLMGQVKLLRRGEPPTPFLDQPPLTPSTDPKPKKQTNDLAINRSAPVKRSGKKLVRFWDSDDVAINPSAPDDVALYPGSAPADVRKKSKVRFLDGGEVESNRSDRFFNSHDVAINRSEAVKRSGKKLVRFWDGGEADVDVYSPACRIGPEPETIPDFMKKKGGGDVEMYSATCRIGPEPETIPDFMKKRSDVKKKGVHDVEMYSATCRIGPEPEMVPMPFSLLRRIAIRA